jgi:hypothetical protein
MLLDLHNLQHQKSPFRNPRKMAVGISLSLLLGILGGGICGAVILLFGGLIGRGGSTGTEHVGYWSVDAAGLGLLYGSLFGAIAGPLAYALVVREIGYQKTVRPALLGTLIGGFLGSVSGPPAAALLGICGFFVALILARPRVSDAVRDKH